MPIPAGVVAPLILAVVLVTSAVAKARQPSSTVSAITLLRLPRFLQNLTLARALPVGEVVLALAMLSPWVPLARLASWAALALFTAYLLIIARAMTFDPRPSCGCFGNIGDQRVRAQTVWRNAVFVALALVFVWFAGRGATVPGTLADLGTTGWLWLVMAAAVGVVVGLIGSSPTGTPRHTHDQGSAPATEQASSTSAIDDDPEGYVREPIPVAVLVDAEGEPHTVAEMATTRAQLLVFANCYCGPTVHALRSAHEWRQRLPQIDVRMVFSGIPVMESSTDLPTDDAWRDHASLGWKAFGLGASPAAVLIGADGLLAGGPVSGQEDVEQFFAEIGEALADAPIPPAEAEGIVVGELVAEGQDLPVNSQASSDGSSSSHSAELSATRE